jgi:hypothetical protein
MEEDHMSKQTCFTVGALTAIGTLMLAPSAHANNPLSAAWDYAYPGSSSGINAGCALCHGDVNKFPLNPYGADLQTELVNLCGAIPDCTLDDLLQGLVNIEALDSDAPNDLTQSSNIVEISADTQPGWAESDNPAGVDGLLDPEQQVAGCVAFVAPSVLDFGPVLLGDSAIASAFITNNGDANCQVDAQVNNASGEFALETAASFTVAIDATEQVDVSYAPLDLSDDTGQLVLTLPESYIGVQLVGSGSPELVDMDIKSLRVTSKVSLSSRKSIDVQLTVENGGDTEGSASATITGEQNDVVVYVQTLPVSDDVGSGSTRYTFQSYFPDAEGKITWTALITDDDPDEDVATATTTVNP